jgi:hypothetical protein
MAAPPLNSPAAARFIADSPLEESGFEPLVPLATEMLIELARGITEATRMLAVGDIGPYCLPGLTHQSVEPACRQLRSRPVGGKIVQ